MLSRAVPAKPLSAVGDESLPKERESGAKGVEVMS